MLSLVQMEEAESYVTPQISVGSGMCVCVCVCVCVRETHVHVSCHAKEVELMNCYDSMAALFPKY